MARLCNRRKNFPPDSDIWNFRWHKNTQLPLLLHQLRSGCYRFSPLQVTTKANGDNVALWSSHDAFNLLSQYLFYSLEKGGTFHTPNKGISRDCALSPLIAGFQLYCIDRHFAQQKHLRYSRYMDDFLILCKTRHHCRQAVLALNQFFNHFGFWQHPDKTFIGRIEKGFDFLGYQFNSTGLVDVSPRSKNNFSNKRHLLYEQVRCASEPPTQTRQRVMVYTNRWCRWASSGLSDALACRLWQAWCYARPWDVRTPAGIPTA